MLLLFLLPKRESEIILPNFPELIEGNVTCNLQFQVEDLFFPAKDTLEAQSRVKMEMSEEGY